MSVYVKNLVIHSHSDFSEELELTQLGGLPTNLTGFGVSSYMRKHPDSSSYTEFTVGITSAADGKISIAMTSPVTSGLKPGRYVYDLLAIRPNGDRNIILEGMVNVIAGFSTNCP
jgi:hypothetical protein